MQTQESCTTFISTQRSQMTQFKTIIQKIKEWDEMYKHHNTELIHYMKRNTRMLCICP